METPEAESAQETGLMQPEAGEGRETPGQGDSIAQITRQLEHSFLFRKLGVVFDYISLPGDFPRSTLPRSGEIREEKPNSFGVGTGMAESTASTCLLLSGYLTRFELGMASPEEERVLDRLVAGLIRLGTMGQRGMLIGGLAPDSRSFYSNCGPENMTGYAHGMLHACASPVLALESQEKLRDICGRWVARMEKDGFVIPGLDLSKAGQAWEARIRRLHILAVARRVSDNPRWLELYEAFITEEEGLCLKPEIPVESTDPEILLSIQLALFDLAGLEVEPERLLRMQLLRRKIAHRLQGQLLMFETFSPDQPLKEAVLDWRQDLADLPGDMGYRDLQFAVGRVWPRLRHEAETVGRSVCAGLAILLSGDRDLVTEHAVAMARLQDEVPWTEIWSIQPLRAYLLLHALGADQGLWAQDRVVEKNTAERQPSSAEAEREDDPDRIGARFGYEPDGETGEGSPSGTGRRNPLFPKSVLDLESEKDKPAAGRSGGRRSRRNRGRRGGGEEGREGRETREGRDGKEGKDGREGRENREAKDGRESKEGREGREGRERREGRSRPPRSSGPKESGEKSPPAAVVRSSEAPQEKGEGTQAQGARRRSRGRRGRNRRPRGEEGSSGGQGAAPSKPDTRPAAPGA